VSNQNQALAICSEFADEYGIDPHDNETIVVYINSKYVNELKNMLDIKDYKISTFQVYGKDALVNFIPKSRKRKDLDI
jgi:hypothetical protein